MNFYKGSILDNFGKNDILVFGSNTEGRHGKGGALLAKEKFGAKYGQAEGLQGRSYAIITKDLRKIHHPSRTRDQIKDQIIKLYNFAQFNREKKFKVIYTTETINLNSYSSIELAQMFYEAGSIPENVLFSESFYQLINTFKTINNE